MNATAETQTQSPKVRNHVFHNKNQPRQEGRQQRPSFRLPRLTDFIMELQDHKFSFQLTSVDNLGDFVEAQTKESGFYHVAWNGGDQYMLALMRAVSNAKYQTFDLLSRAVSQPRVTPPEDDVING